MTSSRDIGVPAIEKRSDILFAGRQSPHDIIASSPARLSVQALLPKGSPFQSSLALAVSPHSGHL